MDGSSLLRALVASTGQSHWYKAGTKFDIPEHWEKEKGPVLEAFLE
jgi:hypothetical protein